METKWLYAYPDPIFAGLLPLSEIIRDKANTRAGKNYFNSPPTKKLFATRIKKTNNVVTSLIAFTDKVDNKTATNFRADTKLMQFISNTTKVELDKLGLPRIAMSSGLCNFNKIMASSPKLVLPKYPILTQKPGSPTTYNTPTMHGLPNWLRTYVNVPVVVDEWMKHYKKMLESIPKDDFILIDDSVSTTTTLQIIVGILERGQFDLSKVHAFAPLKEIKTVTRKDSPPYLNGCNGIASPKTVVMGITNPLKRMW